MKAFCRGLLVVVFGLGFFSQAYAVNFPASIQYKSTAAGVCGGGGYFGTLEEAQDNFMYLYNCVSGYKNCKALWDDGVATVSFSNGCPANQDLQGVVFYARCPSGSQGPYTSVGQYEGGYYHNHLSDVAGEYCTAPTCPAGYDLVGNDCKIPEPQCPASGTQALGSGNYLMSGIPSACLNGCEVLFSGSAPTRIDDQNNLYGTGSYDYTGNTCSSGSSPQSGSGKPIDSGDCESGNKVTIDGVDTCLNAGVSDCPAGQFYFNGECHAGDGGNSGGGSGTSPGDGTNPGDGGNPGGTSPGGGSPVDGSSPGNNGGSPGTGANPGDGTDPGADKDGNCDPKKDFCGGGDTGGLYQKKDNDFQAVFQGFSDGFVSSVTGSAMTGFFNVSIPGGACPDWSASVPYLNVMISVSDYICTPAASTAMDLIGAVLLALASFVGFRWAFL